MPTIPPIIQTAGELAFTPAGSLAATDVQAALVEVDGDVTTLSNLIASDYVPYSGASKAIDLGAQTLDTTGLGTFGNLDVDTLNFNANVISDSTGTISFADDDLITTGDLAVDGGYIGAGTVAQDGELRSYQNFNGSSSFYVSLKTGGGKSGIYRSNTDYFIYYNTSTGDTHLDAGFNGSDLKFDYQGANKTKMYGSTGNWNFGSGEILVGNKIAFTQIDGNEYIDSLADGYVDIGATTQIRFHADLNIGGDTDYVDINDGTGAITWAGTNKKKVTARPNLVEKKTKVSDLIPTQVYRGCNVGYSFPIWNSGAAAEEELYFRMRVPIRWDGTTDPQFGMMITLTGAEDVGDKFKFQLEWQTTTCEGDAVMGETTSNCVSEQTIVTGGGAIHTSYCIFFNLDADDGTNPIASGYMLQGRIRRIAASANEVDAEIALWDWVTMWSVDKAYGAWSIEENVT